MAHGSAALRYSRGLPLSRQLNERLRLLVLEGADKGTCFSALGNVLFIGREGCQILIHDTNISRKHAELTWHSDHYSIRDLGSSNGIVINGRKIPEAKLHAGDILLIGLTVMQVYLPEQRVGAPKPPVWAAPPSATAQAAAKTSLVARKRALALSALFLLGAGAYLSGTSDTMHAPPLSIELEADSPGAHTAPKSEDEMEKIKDTSAYIAKLHLRLGQAEARKAAMEEQERLHLAAISHGHAANELESEVDRQQREDSDGFFHTGVREVQNKNYRRAITAFSTAIIVNPSNDLAKMYLSSAKASMLVELRTMEVAGFRAKGALRYREARMNFVNIVRYLSTGAEGTSFLGEATKRDLDDLLHEAQKELAEMDALEGKGKITASR